jgi:hypothetical protein
MESADARKETREQIEKPKASKKSKANEENEPERRDDCKTRQKLTNAM